ncbi:MAG TPA: MG2 domain-containing protein, partial [Kofleriaceae bacterium]
VITDRPLYEPGNVVKFRAVVLRARDLAPLDGRPGKWIVRDPKNEVILEEKAAAGLWGVVSGTFPLDKQAETGTWKVSWQSSDATEEVPFTVEPFTLPRFRVEATAGKSFYRPGDTPNIRGAVLYSSGAPVANAKIDIQWSVDGDWPPPTEWMECLLPKTAVTAANGRFELALPKIPMDLQGKVTLRAQLGAIDAAGDRVTGAAAVLMSEDGIEVSAVTELGNGLVEGFNNRLYVRVATPDGAVLPGAKIRVKRAWQASDPGQTSGLIEGTLDEDGVASLQIDPGAPVNIVIPALPWRPAAKAAVVTRGEADELIGGQGATLVDQVELDKWLPLLAPCAKWYDDNGAVEVGLRVAAGGNVILAAAGAMAIDRCVAGIVQQRRLPAGAERMYSVTFTFEDPDLPALETSTESPLEMPEGLDEKLAELARGARDCLPRTVEGDLPRALTWRIRAGQKVVELTGWIADPKGGAAAAAVGCVTSRIAGTGRITLAEPAGTDSIGLARFSITLPEAASAAKPQATTMLGYELIVTADIEGKPHTKLRVAPGEVPALRLRVTPILPKPGEPIQAELIRGPSFSGQLPKELVLKCLKHELKAQLDPERKAMLALDPKIEGWCEVTGGSARALVYVRPQAELAVTVTPKQPTYKPGDKAELAIQTRLGGKGGAAAVGLFGVDDSLGQLVALPGVDDLGRVRPKVTTSAPAFGVLDGQALALGRIRGTNAAAATVLRVSAIPQPPELDAVVNARTQSGFDPVEELTDRFYILLAELHVRARLWEQKAPPGDKMRPPKMAELWKQALAACKQRGDNVTDAYGRTLRLSLLPPDLLSLTDPRAVIVVGTRLPEDVENWAAWVAREKP